RNVYQREGCWYCHSQYVRPVAGEDQRWGPVAEVGEYAYDWPHLLSTRRIGPDLSRAGLKVSDHWHFAHHWEPHMLVREVPVSGDLQPHAREVGPDPAGREQ